MSFRLFEDAERSESFDGFTIGREFEVIASDEDGIDAERRENAGGVDADGLVVHGLETFQKRPVFVGVDDLEAFAEIRCQAPGVAGIDGVGDIAALKILGGIPVAIARQDASFVVIGVQLPTDHELAGRIDLIGASGLSLGFAEGWEEHPCEQRDDGDDNEQLDECEARGSRGAMRDAFHEEVINASCGRALARFCQNMSLNCHDSLIRLVRSGSTCKFPESILAAQEETAVSDGRSSEHIGGAQIEFAHYNPFGLTDIDNLSETFLTDAVEVIAGGDGRGAKGTLQSQLPQSFASGGLAAREDASVIEGEQFIAENERAGGAGIELGRSPNLFGRLAGVAGLKDGDSLGRDIKQTAGRGAGRNAGSAFGVFPQDFAGFGFHGGNALGALKGDKGPFGGIVEEDGRGPIGAFGAIHLPARIPRLGIQTSGEGFAVIFDLGDQDALGGDQRGRHSQGVTGVGEIASQATVPEQVSLEIQGDAVIGREEGEDPFAIAGGSGCGDAGFLVSHGSAGGPELAFPEEIALGSVEAQDMEAILFRATGARDENAVADDDGRRQAATWEGRAPGDGFGVELGGNGRIFDHAASERAAELRPIGAGEG